MKGLTVYLLDRNIVKKIVEYAKPTMKTKFHERSPKTFFTNGVKWCLGLHLEMSLLDFFFYLLDKPISPSNKLIQTPPIYPLHKKKID